METMKVYQKVKSPASGEIVRIAAEDEAAVKDGDLMFVIEAG